MSSEKPTYKERKVRQVKIESALVERGVLRRLSPLVTVAVLVSNCAIAQLRTLATQVGGLLPRLWPTAESVSRARKQQVNSLLFAAADCATKAINYDLQLDTSADLVAFARSSTPLTLTLAVGKHKQDVGNLIELCRALYFGAVDKQTGGAGKLANANVVILMYSCADDQFVTIV